MTRRNVKRAWEAPLNVDVPVDLREELDAFCEARKVRIKQVVEVALRKLIADESGRKK